ncbi:T9SS type A sorting domain-containing protein [uncultured Cytophaga sp.]|uniref:T9SS type A sorting domain-containing protein n=1 Tax=uncultured Cytophaga sp. TaxID=160238 RepID=UPI0026193D1E|nr:T9SS type A sorting domain-containing protein [uncultured Cytophaga sp.]
MDKKVTIIFFLLALCMCRYSHAQTNPFYTVTQSNVAPLANSNFVVAGAGAGNTYNPTYPAYTTFLTDGYVLENITSSKHIQGLPIGFNFPYAGQEFDIYAINAKGYIVLGKSNQGGMTVYADTLIETATDTVFTDKNKYLISGLYTGKDMDLQGDVSFLISKGGFEGGRQLLIVISSSKVVDGGSIINLGNIIELKETGQITIRTNNQILFNNTNDKLNSYGSYMQRYGTDYTDYMYTTGATTNSWFDIKHSYNNTDYKHGIVRDTINPNQVSVYPYTITYLPKTSNFDCPVPIRWNPNPPGSYIDSAYHYVVNDPGVYRDSAYLVNDYEMLQGDTISTSDRVWWFSDMRDSLRFDVYLGTDEISMNLYKKGLYADTIVTNFNTVLGLVNLSLDSLAGGQQYFLRINTIHPSGDTTVCNGYSFHTKKEEQIINYCRSDETMGGLDAGWDYSVLDLNTLHFHPDSIIDLLLFYKSVLPDTGSWTTTLDQGQSYPLQVGTIETSYYIQANNLPLVSIFIDYNNDGYFNEDNEFYHTTVASTFRYNDVTITVPSNAVCGKTRLRIVQSDRSPYPDACSKPALGASLSFKDFIINIAPAPGCNLSYSDSIVTPSCATKGNGFLNVVVSGGIEPYHIQWNTGNLADTSFTLSNLASPMRHRATITDAAGCTIRTTMLQMTQPLPLQIDTFFQTKPAFIAFSGGTRPYRAEIGGDKTDTLFAINDTIFLPDVSQGNYTIVATDKNACDPQTYVFNQGVLGIENSIGQQSKVILYPNPATNYIQISGIKNKAFIKICSIDGKIVFETTCTNQQQLFLPNLPSSLYFVTIEEENQRETIKLIIK